MTRYRGTWAEINLDAITNNIEQFKKILPTGNKIMGVVKADGYGHGSVQVAKRAVASGVDFLMVALLEEAVTLREGGIDVPIFVIGRVDPKFAEVAAKHQITLSVFESKWIKAVKEQTLSAPIDIHLEFETGFNRTGIGSIDELEAIIAEVKTTSNVKVTGAYTHFATADEIESEHYYSQRKRYETMLQCLTEIYDAPLMTHVGNSAAGIQYPGRMLPYTRFGVALYGLYPSKAIRELGNVKLEQAMSLYSELVQVKKVKKGEFVGYGATYIAEDDEWIGTLPIGYADGWLRAFQGFEILVDGKRAPIVGRVCMDAMMVKLDKAYEVGQKVTLIGKDEKGFLDMDEVAAYVNTINYEIPCMLTSRIPREYLSK